MPADLRDPTDPREWLRRARSNLALARVGQQGEILLEDLCFEAQQAAEKAAKAVLVSRSVRFRTGLGLSGRLDLMIETKDACFPVDFKDSEGPVRRKTTGSSSLPTRSSSRTVLAFARPPGSSIASRLKMWWRWIFGRKIAAPPRRRSPRSAIPSLRRRCQAPRMCVTDARRVSSGITARTFGDDGYRNSRGS